jgi:opacity protein-like surface antigen
MMKKAFYWSACVLTAAAAAAAPASAADMYGAPGGYKDGPVYANTWTGFYLGGHLGAAWGRDKVTDLDGFDVQGEVTKNNTGASGVYGLQSGYNWQHGNIVFGVEVDLGAMDLNHQQSNRDIGFTDTASLNSGIYGDVTGRLGYAFGPTLIYAKGGFAFFDGKANANGFQGTMKDTSTFTGWTLGGGFEYALTPSWSLKAEYQHFDFGSENSTTPFGVNDDCNTCRFSHDLTVDTVKLGMNYHFGHGFEPLK